MTLSTSPQLAITGFELQNLTQAWARASSRVVLSLSAPSLIDGIRRHFLELLRLWGEIAAFSEILNCRARSVLAE